MENTGLCMFYSEVEEKEVDWLWYPYIPYGKITLLQGDPGDGKSTFMVNVAAIITNGGTLPDGVQITQPETVIYQCAEDNAQDTIKPRMISAGADCSRIAFLNDEDMDLSIVDERIEQAIKNVSARLLVLDPFQAFIPSEGDMQSASKMRGMMRRLGNVAERNHCAIVLIGHMTKASGGKKLYRGLGSIDIAAIARSVLMITRDTTSSAIRYMFPVKSSLAPEGMAIGFSFDCENGFQWLGKCLIADSSCAGNNEKQMSKLDKAKMYLKIILSAEDVESTEVLRKMKTLGIMERTMRTAQKELSIKSYRKQKKWYLHYENVEEDMEE